MLTDEREKKFAQEVSAMVHKDQWTEAARNITNHFYLEPPSDLENPDRARPVVQTYLHYLLNNNGMEEAAGLLWSPTQFNPNPRSTQDVWKLFDEADMGLIMGAASMSKSFSMGVRLLLEWIRDPKWTTIKVLGPSAEHLEANLFSHLVSLHQSSKIPMAGEIGSLFIGFDRRDQISSIRGVIIPIGKMKKAGRLQGVKRKPRSEEHAILGPLSRLFIFVDEIENVPGGLWSDIDNVLANIDPDFHSLKLFGAYNPTNQHDEVAQRAEPEFGWGSFDPDVHFRWRSMRGWEVLRLDGEKSENVLQGKVIYPGLQTRAGLEAIARNAGGRQAGGYFSMGRGAYPPQGSELTIIPQIMVERARAEAIWLSAPQPTGGCDVALEGRDVCSYTLGECGQATGLKYPPTADYPQGRTVMFKDAKGQPLTRWMVQLKQQFPLPSAATPEMKDNVINTTKRAGIRPDYFAIDRTGVGTGVADFVKAEWSTQIYDINYSQSPSKGLRIMLEDAKTCDEDFQQICSQLWFMMRAYFEFGYLVIHPSVDMSLLMPQLTNRRFRMVGRHRKVESKRDYCSRGDWISPGEADSLSLMLFAAWRGSGVTPSMSGKSSGSDNPAEDFDFDSWMEYPGGVRIDVTNQTDYLDENDKNQR